MKVAVKIIILVLAISLAIGGVMMYAKTKVDPPLAIESIDQFSKSLEDDIAMFNRVETPAQEDSLFVALVEKTRFYVSEGKLTKDNGNSEMDQLCSKYIPLFVERSMTKFTRTCKTWSDRDHDYMLGVVNKLRLLRNFDNSQFLSEQSLGSLSLIERIISDYKQARAVSRHTGFFGINDAQTTISKARQYAKDTYLSNCKDLVNDLDGVRSAIAVSHYNYVCAMVEKLSQYRDFPKSDYDTIVTKVGTVITEYDNKAFALYGTKRDTNDLWSMVHSYYSSASEYYKKQVKQ